MWKYLHVTLFEALWKNEGTAHGLLVSLDKRWVRKSASSLMMVSIVLFVPTPSSFKALTKKCLCSVQVFPLQTPTPADCPKIKNVHFVWNYTEQFWQYSVPFESVFLINVNPEYLSKGLSLMALALSAALMASQSQRKTVGRVPMSSLKTLPYFSFILKMFFSMLLPNR